MEDARTRAPEPILQHDLEEALREEALLWALVAAVRRADRLNRSRLDAVLAGCTPGPSAAPPQRQRTRRRAPVPTAHSDAFTSAP